MGQAVGQAGFYMCLRPHPHPAPRSWLVDLSQDLGKGSVHEGNISIFLVFFPSKSLPCPSWHVLINITQLLVLPTGSFPTTSHLSLTFIHPYHTPVSSLVPCITVGVEVSALLCLDWAAVSWSLASGQVRCRRQSGTCQVSTKETLDCSFHDKAADVWWELCLYNGYEIFWSFIHSWIYTSCACVSCMFACVLATT